MGSAARLARARLRGAAQRRVVRPKRARAGRRDLALVAIEVTSLGGAALIAVIAALGQFADWFVGAGLWRHLLPFAAAVLVLAAIVGGAIWGWFHVRRPLCGWRAWAPAALSIALTAGALWFALQPAFRRDVHDLQALIGGQA